MNGPMDDSSQIPGLPGDFCPDCGGPLTEPREGQHFVPIDIPTMEPSKVCETCKVGYWLAHSGWLAVATIDHGGP